MKALLLGSIGTLSDTSELQREAFNAAFRLHRLPWHWDLDAYRALLQRSGGAARIAARARAEGRALDADAVHATKSRLFGEMLAEGRASPRPGLRAALDRARAERLPLGLVTTTSRANVTRLLDALDVDGGRFGVIVTADLVAAPKPAPDCYHLAAAMLATKAEDCLAVEDNLDGLRAARAAGVPAMAWPNGNTAGHDFGDAPVVDGALDAAVFGAPVAAR